MKGSKKIIEWIFIGTIILLLGVFIYSHKPVKDKFSEVYDQTKVVNPLITITEPQNASPSVSISPTASPSPTVKPLSFAEMNSLYGPCTNLPVLMYHHVEPIDLAKANKRTGLDVPPEMFRSQMEYLNKNGYQSITPSDLVNFFDNGTPMPSKPILITFDDGYVDNGDLAFPIMRELGIKGTIYIPTGLMENFNYLTWAKINEMQSSGMINFGNHTWSHLNVGKNQEIVTKEISTADKQLIDYGLNQVKTFAYPYGLQTKFAENLLSSMGYKLAFTTVPGRIMCKKQRFSLPRIRVGNSNLSNFGI